MKYCQVTGKSKGLNVSSDVLLIELWNCTWTPPIRR